MSIMLYLCNAVAIDGSFKSVTFMEKLTITDLRILLSALHSGISFMDYLSDSESAGLSDSARDNQDCLYDKLYIYIKLLQELYKYRSLPF